MLHRRTIGVQAGSEAQRARQSSKRRDSMGFDLLPEKPASAAINTFGGRGTVAARGDAVEAMQ
jgi:hypothetical protein